MVSSALVAVTPNSALPLSIEALMTGALAALVASVGCRAALCNVTLLAAAGRADTKGNTQERREQKVEGHRSPGSSYEWPRDPHGGISRSDVELAPQHKSSTTWELGSKRAALISGAPMVLVPCLDAVQRGRAGVHHRSTAQCVALLHNADEPLVGHLWSYKVKVSYGAWDAVC